VILKELGKAFVCAAGTSNKMNTLLQYSLSNVNVTAWYIYENRYCCVFNFWALYFSLLEIIYSFPFLGGDISLSNHKTLAPEAGLTLASALMLMCFYYHNLETHRP
jgi:hypothetical protein